jgi:peptide/nickel transport system permease protein
MSKDSNTDKSATDPEDGYRSYPEIVWGQFRQYPLSYASLMGIGVLFLIALVVPAFALNSPFLLIVPESVPESALRQYVQGGDAVQALYGTSFPWFYALFDLNFFENNIDIFFNFLLFTIPLNVVVWFVYQTVADFESDREFVEARGRFIGVSLGLQVTAVIAVLIVATSSGGTVDLGTYAIYSLPANVLIGVLWVYLVDPPTDALRNQTIKNFVYFSLAIHAVTLATFLGFDFRQPYVNYRGIADLEGVQAVFPFFDFSYRNINIGAQMTSQGPSWAHWLGTDAQGRDVFVRLLYGTRISLTIGIIAMAIATAIGMFVGSLGGYFGGWVDAIVLRVIEVFLVFPAFYLILTLSGFVKEPSVFYVMGIIGIVYWTGIARLVRGEFLRLREEDFVQAAKALGLPERRIIFRHVLPNALGPVLVNVTFGIAGAILFEATISFLGVGDPTAPTWGQILNGARENYRLILMLAPGFALFVTITMLNLVGEGIRDAMDPKLRK